MPTLASLVYHSSRTTPITNNHHAVDTRPTRAHNRGGPRSKGDALKTQPLSELKTEFLFEMSVDLEEAQPIGLTPHGNRQIVYVKGGTVEGPKIKAEVLPGGGDWFLMRPDGVGELDVRATLRTDDGHLIYSYYRGIFDASPDVFQRVFAGETVDPSEYYFRIAPFYETGSEKYAWLNRIVAVGVGRMAPLWVGYSVYAIL